MRLIYFFIIIIIMSSCSLIEKDSSTKIDLTHCEENSDCLKDEICDASYCVSSKIENSKAFFDLKFIPQNNLNKSKYYHSFSTSVLNGEDLKESNRFNIEVSNYVEFSGEIRNNRQMDLSYNLILYDEENDIRFYAHSYKDGEKTYFHFKIPDGAYSLRVYPSDFYPPFTIDIDEISSSNKDNLIIVDREIDSKNYSNILGAIKVSIDDSIYFPYDYKVYAFVQKNNSEIIISNKFTCNEDCENFKLTILNTEEDVYLKVTLDLLENIEFKIPIKDIDDMTDGGVEIDLGDFYRSNSNKIILSGECEEILKNIEIEVSGSIGKYAKYKNSFNYSCDSTSCNNKFNLYEGNYNIFIKPSLDSCYKSKFLNIDLKREASDIRINLDKKKLISGILISTTGSSIEGVVTFTRKDNSLSDFIVVVNSNEKGEFNVLLEPGEYDVFIKPQNSSINSSNWIYLNQRITVNTNDLLYLIPRSYKIPLYLYAQGNKPLAQAQVTMNLHNLDEVFSDDNGYLYPESYPLYESITDSEGKFILSVPIIE